MIQESPKNTARVGSVTFPPSAGTPIWEVPDVAYRTCSIEGCDEKHKARGYCNIHYQRWRAGSANMSRPTGEGRFCSVDGCDSSHSARDLCAMHYERWRRNGDPGEAAARTIDGDIPKVECPGCEKSFQPARVTQRFCSRRCQSRVWKRDEYGISIPEQTRRCGYCERDFSNVDGRILYCSDECAVTADSLNEARFRYGITMQEYRTLWLDQKGVCAICSKPERTRRNRLLAIDHDHNTGHIRGLLCSQCNRAIGLLNDDPEVIDSAARYVRAARRVLVVVSTQPTADSGLIEGVS